MEADNVGQIRKRFDLNDDSVYQWKVDVNRSKMFRWLYFVTTLLVHGLFHPMIIVCALYLLSMVLASLVYYATLLIVCLLLVFVIIFHTCRIRSLGMDKRRSRQYSQAASIVVAGFLYFLLVSPCSHFANGFQNSENASLWQWLLFYIDNFASTILLDICDVMEFRISIIVPESTISGIMIVMFRTVLAFGIIQVASNAWPRPTKEIDYFGTVRECYSFCVQLNIAGSESKGMSLTKYGDVVPRSDKQKVSLVHFLKAFEDDILQ